jgi:hypothetical protein
MTVTLRSDGAQLVGEHDQIDQLGKRMLRQQLTTKTASPTPVREHS